MIAESQFVQCSLCFKYVDSTGAHLDPQPRIGDGIGVPQLTVCAMCIVNPPPEDIRPAFNRPRRKSESKPCGQPHARPAGTSWAEHSLPPERDDDRPAFTHKDKVVHFDSQSAGRDELVLRELCLSFDLAQPERTGAWVTGIYFLHKFGIKAANSCASRLRRSHPFILDNDLDIDSTMIPNGTGTAAEWWAYRICRRCDSERIQREAKRRREDNAQREFGE